MSLLLTSIQSKVSANRELLSIFLVFLEIKVSVTLVSWCFEDFSFQLLKRWSGCFGYAKSVVFSGSSCSLGPRF